MSKARTGQPVEGQTTPLSLEQAAATSARLFLQSVVGALNVGRLAEATRRFEDGLDRGLCPHDADLLLWLVRGVGLDPAVRLIDAYAQAACFACRHGVVVCEDCNGCGRQSTGATCPRCIGIGCVRCSLCNSSGASAATHVPGGLYLAVMVRRLDDAVDDLRCLLGSQLPAAECPDFHAVRGDCYRMLLEAHRLMSVFGNTWCAATQVTWFLSGRKGLASRAARASRRHAARARLRMWRVVEVLAQQAERESCDAASAGQAHARARALFYRSLLAKPAKCRGTILDREILGQTRGSRVAGPFA